MAETQGTAERASVLQQQPMNNVARVVDVPLPPVSMSNTLGAQRGIQQFSNESATLATVLEKGAPLGLKMMQRSMQIDFHDGQMAYQQGKAINELGGMASGAAQAGFMSMQAASAADAAYVQSLDEIDKADKMLNPEQFKAKRSEAFQKQLTGNPMFDEYLTKLNVDIDNKLARAHAQAHANWQNDETMNSATNLLVSKAKVGDLQMTEGFINGKDSPLRNLSPENQRKVILDAVNESLQGESDSLFEHLGGIEGIRSKFNPTYAEMSALDRAHDHFKKEKENKYNAEWERGQHAINTKVLTGALTYEQGLSAIEALAKGMGMGDATLKGAANKVAGIDQSRISMAMAEARAAARQQKIEQQHKDNAAAALSTNTISMLDHKELGIALDMQKGEIVKQVQSDGYQGIDAVQQMNTRYASFLNKAGVVDPKQAELMTGVFNSTSNLVDSNGKVTPQAFSAYHALTELDKINPDLALQHLKTPQAKEAFKLARDLDQGNEDSNSALRLAASAMQNASNIDPKKIQVNKDAIGPLLNSSLRDSLDTAWNGMFHPSNWGKALSSEIDSAVNDPSFIGKVQRLASARMVANPALTPKQSLDLTMHDMKSTTSFIMGSMVSTPNNENIYKTMGMQEFSNDPSAPNKAMLQYIEEHGKEAFGKQWIDTKIVGREGDLTTRLYNAAENVGTAMIRGVPKMDVRFTDVAGKPMFVVMPYLTDGNVGRMVYIDPAKVGASYKQKHYDSVANDKEFWTGNSENRTRASEAISGAGVDTGNEKPLFKLR